MYQVYKISKKDLRVFSASCMASKRIQRLELGGGPLWLVGDEHRGSVATKGSCKVSGDVWLLHRVGQW